MSILTGQDNEVAPRSLDQLPEEVRYVLGDTHYNDPELRRHCHRRGCELVATRRGPYPHRELTDLRPEYAEERFSHIHVVFTLLQIAIN